jgi:hypothetical protein
MNTTRQLAHAAILAAGFLAAPIFSAACTVDSAKPFNSGPFDPAGSQQGLFSEWIVDSNGIGLQVCTDSVAVGGGTAPCLTTPPIATNPLSVALNRGVEAFYYLANSKFTTTGAFPVDGVMVMGIETAFLSPQPDIKTATQFSRLRTRLNVNHVGQYTIETPWTKTFHIVDTLLKPGNGQNRDEISVPIDRTFPPNAAAPGLVTPFLVADNKPAFAGLINPVTNQPFNPANYLGDGVTLTTVTGSPCGTNFVRVTAFDLDGVTPVDINNGSNVYTEPLFTVMGKTTPVAPTPLAISSVTYTRSLGSTTLAAMATGSPSATSAASLTVGTSVTPMAHEGPRFYANVPVVGALPATVSITTSDPSAANAPNTQTATVKDLVTIGLAEARCSGVGILKSCLLTVNASSSDDGSGGVTPTLTLAQPVNLPLVNGAIATVSTAIPAMVTVTSSAGGAAITPVTVINQ